MRIAVVSLVRTSMPSACFLFQAKDYRENRRFVPANVGSPILIPERKEYEVH